MSNQMGPDEHRKNNFDFLRHLAAFLVIYGHGFAMLGVPYPRIWGTPVSVLGVLIFFSLSGYLVTESWERDPRIIPFLFKRSLRIFPALAVCVVLSAVVLGPLMTEVSLQIYFTNSHFYRYFTNILLYIRYNLPGVFTHNPLPNAINGSLWSLPAEFFCYLTVILLAYARPRKWRIRLVTGTGLVLIGIGTYFSTSYRGPQIVFYATDVAAAGSVIPYFFVASILRLLKGKIPLRLDVALIASFGLFVTEAILPGPVHVATCCVAIPYIVLAFGSQATPILRSWGRFGDFSYGMYLYSFPIQQTLIAFFKDDLSPNGLLACSAAASVAAAYFSWHLVEKTCLRLKAQSFSERRSPELPAKLTYVEAA